MSRHHNSMGEPPPFEFLGILDQLPEANANVRTASNLLDQYYRNAWNAFYASDSDPFRLRVHSDRLLHRAMPLFDALVKELGPRDELLLACNRVAELLVMLQDEADYMETQGVQ